MAKEEVQRLHEDVMRDSGLQERIRQAKDDESLVDLVLKIGQEKGYRFTKAEVAAYVDEVNSLASRKELTDEKLKAIAGGRAVNNAYLDNCSCLTGNLKQ